ncbi:hypothetical protein PGTUg99_007780 [Puccinia graminis f. sp. tritici]|uniref:Uncharacterized protein n=1 Tax=Puccinia graminis f. sp. tritici TaxID=56615 RepID=A0A5B0MK56_PUCGR|nr:hypothetical protein PGTUg99_002904 [Puccinia graminis f. sp. tritici]KAA1132318.1 hypothetical protein PGTUg99_007780 [Puccinia graminis f. sp. tritici]
MTLVSTSLINTVQISNTPGINKAHELRVTGLRFHGPRAQGSMAPGQDPPAHSAQEIAQVSILSQTRPLEPILNPKQSPRRYNTQPHLQPYLDTAHPQSDALPSRQSTYVQKLQVSLFLIFRSNNWSLQYVSPVVTPSNQLSPQFRDQQYPVEGVKIDPFWVHSLMDTYFLSVIKTIGIQGKISSSFHLGLSRGRLFRPVYKEVDFNPFSARSLIDCFYVSATKADKFTLNSVINTQLSEFDRLSLLFRNQNQQPLKARNSRLSSPFHDLSQHPFKVLFLDSNRWSFCFRDQLRAFQGKSLPVPLTYYWINHRTSIVSFARSPLISSSSRFHHHSRYHDPPFNLCISNHLYIGFHDPRARDLSAQVFSIPTSALLVPQSNRLNFGFRDQVRRLLQTAPLIWQSTLV